MGEERFDVVFEGGLVGGIAPEAVAANLAKLFKATPETVARLLGGGTHVLKRDVDAPTAERYRAAMQQAGAVAVLRPIAATAGAGAARGLSVADAGSDLLAPHERREHIPAEIDTSHIRLLSAFAEPAADQRPPPAAAPDTSHITIAEAGADLLPDREPASPPPAPDTGHLSLAPPGAQLEELRDRRPPLAPDTSALALLPPA